MAFADVLCFGMGTGATGLAKSGGMVNTVPEIANIAYFPTIRKGYGLYGKNGLMINRYKIEIMYQNQMTPGGGGGTIFSIKDFVRKEGGLFRIDYGKHVKNTPPTWHWHGRIWINDVKYGSNKPHRLY